MLAYVYLLIAVLFRFLIPVFGSRAVTGMMGFTPVVAALLYFGYKQPRSRLWIPVVMFAAGDIALSRLVYGYPLSADLLFSWAFYALAVLLGSLLKENASVPRVAGASLAGSIAFFVLSNFAVWAAWQMYPKTLAGLGACYVAALPFFRNAVVGDLAFTAVFFALPVLVAQFGPERAEARIRS
jgi:hypothetical protein